MVSILFIVDSIVSHLEERLLIEDLVLAKSSITEVKLLEIFSCIVSNFVSNVSNISSILSITLVWLFFNKIVIIPSVLEPCSLIPNLSSKDLWIYLGTSPSGTSRRLVNSLTIKLITNPDTAWLITSLPSWVV